MLLVFLFGGWYVGEDKGLPVSVGGAALAIGALGALVGTTLAVGRSCQVTRGSAHDTLLKCQSARLAVIRAVIVFKLDNLAAKRMLIAVRVRVSGEPLSVVGEAKVEDLGISTEVQVILDNFQRSLDTGLVRGYVVTAVHQIVAHNVDHVNGLENLGTRVLVPGNHVLLAAGDGDREGLVANFLADGGEELGVGLDFGDLVGVRHLLVVLAVAAGVLPVDV